MLTSSITFAQLVERWARPDFAGLAVGANSRPKLLAQSGLLIVEVYSPTWAHELERRAPAILARLPLVEGNRVERLVFRYFGPAPESGDGRPAMQRRRRPQGRRF